jgi:hypothetical protein
LITRSGEADCANKFVANKAIRMIKIVSKYFFISLLSL